MQYPTPLTTASLTTPNLINRSPSRRGFPVVLLAFALAFVALPQMAPAVTPAPDGGYPQQNTAEGDNALFSNTTGQLNTALGYVALYFNTTGQYNTAIGNAALYYNKGGNFNTATGVYALLNNTTGNNNTATGTFALEHNTAGISNTAAGLQALLSNTSGSQNTANGASALRSNNASGNTADGFQALLRNTIGTHNTATGGSTLQKNTTGSFNIAVGSNAGANLTTGDNNIDVGATGVAGESNTMRLGTGKLTATFITGIRGIATVNANAVPVVIDSAGQLGTVSSSRRFKDEIKPMDKTSEALLSLKPVTFHYKTDSKGTPQFGLIAEEVAKVNPNLVVRDENGEIYTVRYEAVNAMLLNEFLKEHRNVAEQESTIAELKTTVAQQQKQIEALTATVRKVSDQIALGKPAPQLVANP